MSYSRRSLVRTYSLRVWGRLARGLSSVRQLRLVVALVSAEFSYYHGRYSCPRLRSPFDSPLLFLLLFALCTADGSVVVPFQSLLYSRCPRILPPMPTRFSTGPDFLSVSSFRQCLRLAPGICREVSCPAEPSYRFLFLLLRGQSFPSCRVLCL